MSENGAVLQSYNMELVKYIEYLKDQREDINCQIDDEEQSKKQVMSKIDGLAMELKGINKLLEEKYRKRDICEKAIAESENGLLKIIESSKVLLTSMKRETEALNSS